MNNINIVALRKSKTIFKEHFDTFISSKSDDPSIKLLISLENYVNNLIIIVNKHIDQDKYDRSFINEQLHFLESCLFKSGKSEELQDEIQNGIVRIKDILNYEYVKTKILRLTSEIGTFKFGKENELVKIKVLITLLRKLPQIPENIYFIKSIIQKLNTKEIQNAMNQNMKKSILNLAPPVTNYSSSNISKIKKLQTVIRAKQNVQTQYVNALLKDMEKEGNFNYYINKINKVHKKIPEVLKNPRLKNNAHSVITTEIAPCHIRHGMNPLMYLRQLRNQLQFAVRLYHKKKVKDPSFSKRFFKRLKGELGGRPCLENLIEGLSVALYEPEFVWKGRNISPLLPNNNRYLNLISNTVRSFQESQANNKNAKNLPLSLERRKKIFWDMIKNKSVHVAYKNIFGRNQIGYQNVKRYNKNGKRFFSSNASNWLEYIGRKDQGTLNFFRKKIAVKKIEKAYKDRKKGLPPLKINGGPVNNGIRAPKANNRPKHRMRLRARK
jgi:hypothetical protein